MPEVEPEIGPSIIINHDQIDVMEGLNNILELDDNPDFLGFPLNIEVNDKINIDDPPTQPQVQPEVQPQPQPSTSRAGRLLRDKKSTFVRRRDQKKPEVRKSKPFTTKNKLKRIDWKKGHLCTIDSNILFEGNDDVPQDLSDFETPLQFFSYFFTDDLFQYIIDQTKLFATQKGQTLVLSMEDLKHYVGICLLTGVIHLLNLRNYWKPTIGVEVICKAMRVNQFEKIRRFLHFNDNTVHESLPPEERDRLFKIRPLIDSILERFQTVPIDQKLSLDKQVCAIKAIMYLKNYLPKKPHKWGYKLYVLSSVDGFVYNFEIYSGADHPLLPNEPELDASGNVVVRLCRILRHKNHQLYFDNYYSSIPLCIYLFKRGILTLRTIARNRIQSDPLTNVKTYNKVQDRGNYEERICQILGVLVSIIGWKDNKVVSFISTFVGGAPETTIKRYDRKAKEKSDVVCPNVVKVYNKHMGDVDTLDAHLNRYRITLRSKKWYMRLFYHMLDVVTINAFLMWKKVWCGTTERNAR